MVSIFWDSQGVIIIGYFEQDCTINGKYHAGELVEAALPGNHKKEAKKNDSRCSALPTRHKLP